MADRLDKTELSLKRAVDAMTPDLCEKLAHMPVQPLEEPDAFLQEEGKTVKPVRTRWVYRAASIAAVFILLIGIGWYQFLAVDSVVGLDVNPSLEFTVNRQNRVTDVKTYNKDARKVVKSLDLKNVEVHTAVSAVLGSMLQNGYIDSNKNTVLLTVQNKDGKKAKTLEKDLLADINEVLSGAGTEGRLVSQTIADSKDLSELSKKYHISCGKMKLIKSIISKNDTYSPEELSKMSVQKLMELVGEEQIDLHDNIEYDEGDFHHEGHEGEGQERNDSGHDSSYEGVSEQNNSKQNSSKHNSSSKGEGSRHHGEKNNHE